MAKIRPDDEERLIFADTMRDLLWFTALFSAVVGGPSILSILQTIFVEHRLVDALQWIVDGYDAVVAVLGAAVEPLLVPLIAWFGGLFGWEMSLQPYWKPLFLLAMLPVTSLARMARDVSGFKLRDAAATAVRVMAALAGAVAASLLPLDGGWWVQGLAAALPIALVSGAIAATLSGDEWYPGVSMLAIVAGFAALAAVAFACGAALALQTALGFGAGLLALGGVLMVVGAGFALMGFRDADTVHGMVGVTLLGGFVTAGLILAADAAIKMLSS